MWKVIAADDEGYIREALQKLINWGDVYKRQMFCSLKGYEPCKNQDEIVEQIGYDSERDLDNPTGSVFCAHGAGFVVPWYEVEEYMHLDTGIMAEFEDDLSEEDWEDAASGSGNPASGDDTRCV